MFDVDPFRLTELAKVEVRTHGAHVPHTCNRATVASITDEPSVNLALLVLHLLLLVVLVQRLEAISAEGLNLFFDNLDDVSETLKVELTRAVALAAGEALLVDLSTLALEAVDLLFNALF